MAYGQSETQSLDFDGNGSVDERDAEFMAQALKQGNTDLCFDLDQDGQFTAKDISFFRKFILQDADEFYLNLDHLDFLSEDITIDGQGMTVMNLYAEPNDRNDLSKGYHYVGDAQEGFACLDDTARAVVALAEHYRLYQDEHSIQAGSYTHLDVYKRQLLECVAGQLLFTDIHGGQRRHAAFTDLCIVETDYGDILRDMQVLAAECLYQIKSCHITVAEKSRGHLPWQWNIFRIQPGQRFIVDDIPVFGISKLILGQSFLIAVKTVGDTGGLFYITNKPDPGMTILNQIRSGFISDVKIINQNAVQIQAWSIKVNQDNRLSLIHI